MNQEKEIPTAEAYMNICLGGNMNIATLKPIVFQEMMIEFAKLHRSNLIECFSERTSLSKEFLNGFYPESNIK